MEKILQDLKQNVSALSPRSLAQLLHLCKAHAHVPPSAISLLVQEAKVRSQEERFGDIETATIVHSLACLTRVSRLTSFRRSEIADLCLHLTEDLIEPQRLQGLTDRILANMVYGLGVLFKSDEDACERHPRLKRCIEALSMEICKEHHLVAFTQQGMANILYAYGCLRWRSKFVMVRLAREIINRICGFRSHELAYMILALSRLNYLHEDLIVTLGIEAVSGHHMTRLSQQDLCHILYGLQSLATGLSSDTKLRPVIDQLFREAGSPHRLSKYNAQDVTTVLHCIATQKRDADLAPNMEKLAHRLLSRFEALMGKKPKLDKHLSSVLHNCAKMKLKNEQFVLKATSCIVRDYHTLDSAWTVTLLLWTLATLDALSADVFLGLCHRLCDLRKDGASMEDRNWVQLTRAIQYMEQSRDSVQLDPRVRDLLEEALSVSKSSSLEFTLPQNTRAHQKETV